MTHFLLLALFCSAVGIVLGTMLRDNLRGAAALAAWIAGSMIAVALVVAWLMYLLP